MQLVVVRAVSAAVAAAMSMRRIASQTEFFFIVVNLVFFMNVHYYLGRYAQNLTLYERKSISKFINSYL